jgi:hypothetical protein
MSKSLIPSRGLLSSFSQCLRVEKNQLGGGGAIQCRNLFSTSTFTPLSRIRVGMSRGEMGARESTRWFSTSSAKKYKTVEEQRSRYRSGVCLPIHFLPFPHTATPHHAIDILGTSSSSLTSSHPTPTSLPPFNANSSPSPSPTALASSSSSQAQP